MSVPNRRKTSWPGSPAVTGKPWFVTTLFVPIIGAPVPSSWIIKHGRESLRAGAVADRLLADPCERHGGIQEPAEPPPRPRQAPELYHRRTAVGDGAFGLVPPCRRWSLVSLLAAFPRQRVRSQPMGYVVPHRAPGPGPAQGAAEIREAPPSAVLSRRRSFKDDHHHHRFRTLTRRRQGAGAGHARALGAGRSAPAL